MLSTHSHGLRNLRGEGREFLIPHSRWVCMMKPDC